jgi:uncharacterized membrane protein
MARYIRLFVVSLAAMACATIARVMAQPMPPAQYTAQDIGLLPGAFSNVPWAINNAGHVVGWNQGPQTLLRAYIWRPGKGISELPPPPGFSESLASDISNTGIVVGAANNGLNSTQRVWRRMDGQYLIVPTPGDCVSTFVHGVNDHGDMVGENCTGGFGSAAWYYSDATGYIDLTPFGVSVARDINNAGVVTGSASGQPCRWQAPAGPLELLPTLPAPYNDAARGEGINESNQVVGISINILTGSDHWRAFRYSDGEGIITLSNPVIARSSAYAINETGHVIGTDGTTSTTDRDGWVWTPEQGKQLIVATVDGVDVFGTHRTIDINDSGQIAASVSSPEAPSGAVMLTPINVGPMTGACCFADGTCAVLTEADCAAQNGVYRGDDTDCASVACDPPATGACCVEAECLVVTEAECAARGGIYQGDSTECTPGLCEPAPPTGACCITGECVTLTQEECLGAGGVYLGDGVPCGPSTCMPAPTGACCIGATCVEGTEADCAAQGGVYQGDDTRCGAGACQPPPPSGACCLADGTCVELTEALCTAREGTYQGDSTTCDAAECPQPCRADWDMDGLLNSNDFFAFLEDYFAGEADFNQSGVTNSDDYFAFLTAFFEGCE